MDVLLAAAQIPEIKFQNPMKKFALILAAATLFASPVLAQKTATKAEPKFPTTLGKKDTREDITPFDFQKLFADAESQFKAAKAWDKLKCEPKSGFVCTKHECVKRSIKATILLDKDDKTITRCENKNCETFPAEFDQTGVFVNVQTQGPVGTLIRILGDSRYKEITTVGLDAYIANGNCEVVTD